MGIDLLLTLFTLLRVFITIGLPNHFGITNILEN
jgi:hypothetical protein